MNVATVLKSKGRQVTTATPSATVRDITDKLAGKRIGVVVIVDDASHVSGIISERDVVRVIAERGPAVLDTPVGEVMTRNVITCNESNSLDELMETMTKGRFRHLPVVEGGELRGLISIGDVVKYHLADMALQVSAMQNYLATG